ncbi:MAG: hypothetical protein JNL90_15640 [Planctomycetes bacterium]|nr:hypothetical protein [Planctomycetota bacterium]
MNRSYRRLSAATWTATWTVAFAATVATAVTASAAPTPAAPFAAAPFAAASPRTAPLLAPIARQERGKSPTAAPAPAPALAPLGTCPAIDERDAVLTTYMPSYLDVATLEALANDLFGGLLTVEQWDNDRELVVNRTKVDQFLTFGRSLLIRNSAAHAAQIVATLREFEEREQQVDEREQEEAQRQLAVQQATNEASGGVFREAKRITREFRPRHVPLALLQQALQPFERFLVVGINEQRPNFNWIVPANLLLVEEKAERLEEIATLIERIDRPAPQLQVTALILQSNPLGTAAGGTADLPGELGEALALMAPSAEFSVLSSAVLRCTVRPDRRCRLSSSEDLSKSVASEPAAHRAGLPPASNPSRWELSFAPAAFDAEHGTLELSQCNFELQRAQSHGAQASSSANQSFETEFTAAIGEWTVIGAVGAQPVFVALRLDPVSDPHGNAPPKATPPGGR